MDDLALAARLEELGTGHREEWRVDREAHRYADGTAHFNHVRYTARPGGEELQVEVAHYVTPELAELLCLLHNNIGRLVDALRRV